uniref:Uncharacterized protein n=1 Tax=Rhizophora mucronata TaxID=61149 RepID=A0A2P2NET8_RHIMU
MGAQLYLQKFTLFVLL